MGPARSTGVSVVIPAHNAARFLRDAIDSVLDQEALLEVLVVDDGSTDDTATIAAGYGPPVRCLSQPNQGVAVARNLGIEASRGGLVAFLDADDTWLPSKLARQVAALVGQPDHGLCYSAFLVVDSNLDCVEVRHSDRRGSAFEDLLTRGNVVGSVCTVLCERALLERVGGFDATLSQCADWDMWVRLAEITEFLYVDEPLVTYRQHASNMSRDARLLEKDSVRVLEKGFALPGVTAELRARRRRALGRNDMALAGTYYRAGLWRDFLRCAARALARDPHLVGRLAAYPIRAARRQRGRGDG